jgi:hypothetical protein
MSLVKDPVARAQKATTKVQAARLHLELESELGLNEGLPDGWEPQAERALQILESKASEQGWGDLTEPDATTALVDVGGGRKVPKTWSPSLSHGARRTLESSDEPAPSGPAPKVTASTPPSRRRAARAHSARRRLGIGLPTPPIGGARNLVGTALWGVLGLTLLYLLLQDAENPGRRWPSAVQTAVGSITTAIMALVRPVDPLRPHSAAPATSAPAVHVARTPTSGPTPLPAKRPDPTLRVAHPSTTHLVHPVSRM